MIKMILTLLFISGIAGAQVNTSPNMNLPVPIPGVTPGPQWAQDVVSSLNQIDSHNHSFGQGVLIQPNGMNINTDLTFNSNDATLLRTVRFDPQSAPITSAAPDVGAIYVSGNELYYNDVSGGNSVKITTNGSVNSGAGSITGLPSGTASASYAGGTFIWQSATNTAANMDAGSYILRNATISSNGLTLQPPPAMAANYAITLPTLPITTNIMSMDQLGNIAAAINVDNSTLQLSANTLAVKSGGIAATQIANATITHTQIAANTITLGNIDQTSALPSLKSQDFTALGSSSFVVPTGSTSIMVFLIGGGGGGGGGRGLTGVANGGGGGGGVNPMFGTIAATPGETLTVVVGSAGAGGAANNVGGTGATGGSGNTTSVQRSGTILMQVGGGNGGAGGSSGGGGAGGAGTYSSAGLLVGGGVGGAGGAGGAAGTNSFYGLPGNPGAGDSGTSGGGGSGAAGFGAGANGGAAGANGSNVVGANYGSGGGGGGGSSGGAAGNGGNGGAGFVRILWVTWQ